VTKNLITSVVINKSTGMKEITTRSPIMFKNNLEIEININIPTIGNTQADENNRFLVVTGEKFAFPLNLNVGESKVYFSTSKTSEKEGKSLHVLIKDGTSENYFAQEEMLSCDSENELATHKEGYLRYEKDEKIQLINSDPDIPNLNFCLSCYKRKVNANIKKKGSQSTEFCWETYLVATLIYTSQTLVQGDEDFFFCYCS